MSDETKPDVGVCDGCGSTKTLEELRASGHLSCCPERRMLSASEWKSRADNAEDEITRLRDALEGMIDLAEAANLMDDPAYVAARKELE